MKSSSLKQNTTRPKDDPPAKGKPESRERTHSNSVDIDLNVINVNLAIFSLFIALVFSYFVYFSHQLTEIKSEIYSRIIEINAIDPPFPWSFLSIQGHNEYYYLKRREVLFEEFRKLKEVVQQPGLNESDMAKYGKQVQIIITQIAYFFPYKRMLDFRKDGSVTFDPNRFESIETAENLKSNIPGYAVPRDSSRTYSPEFLKEQADHILNSHRRFTLELKDGKDKIVQAMIIGNALSTDYDKARVRKYIDGLIAYLENHYKMAIPLGLTIKKYDYLLTKSKPIIIISLSALLIINLISGVVVPLFYNKARNSKIIFIIPLISFVVGIVVLFSEALYSLAI